MARGKKKESTLTPEEKLAQVLVPDWEWPYKVPENWCWTRLMHVAKWGAGGTPSRRNPAYYEGCIPWIKTGELNDDYIYETEEHISDEAVANSSAKLFPINTVAIAMYGATIGKVGILGVEATTNQACACAVASPALDYRYLFRYAQSQKDAFIKKGKGGAQPNISQEIIKEHEIPLPPLAEQQRIVDRIEYLFAKLDEAKEKAQSVLDSFETRKAAILHNAFTGELTSKWRAENGVSKESWKTTAMQDVCEKIVCGKTPKEHITAQGEVPYLKVYNIVNNQVDFISAPQFIPNSIHVSKLQSSILKPNDVIMNIVGPPLRKIAIIPDTYPEWNMNQAIVRFRPLSNLLPRFLYYALINPETLDDVIAATKGVVGQANISVSQSRNLVVNLPSIPEQNEIIRILDSLFAKEQQAKEAAEAVLEKIDLLKKAILARAFRGELGTNDPTEESTLELLKTVI